MKTEVIRDETGIPLELREPSQWVVWKHEDQGRRKVKIPYDPKTNKRANVKAPTTWSDLMTAIEVCESNGYDGIGFVFTQEDSLVGIDLDNCRNPDTGEIEPWAKKIIQDIDSRTEVSPSGTGVKIFIKGRLLGNRRRKGNVEIYDTERYFTVTGDLLDGVSSEINECQEALDQLYSNTFGSSELVSTQGDDQPHSTFCTSVATLPTNVALAAGRMTDEEIVAEAENSKNGFGQLWRGETSGYGSQSEADLALCNCLASKTDSDPLRIDILFRQSGLMREKWERTDYREQTIEKSLSTAPAVTIASTTVNTTNTENKEKARNAKDEDGWTRDAEAIEASIATDLLYTDIGNGIRFSRYKDEIRFCPEEGWLNWTGKVWKRDNRIQTARISKSVVEDMFGFAQTLGDEDKKSKLRDWANKSSSEHKLRSMIHSAESVEGMLLPSDQLDKRPMLFNCENGTLNLETGELQPHNSQDFLTQFASISFRPELLKSLQECNTWDESWERMKTHCPTWVKFISRIFNNNRELKTYIHRLLGYFLTGLVKEEVMPIFYGIGANGKTTLLETVSSIMGPYATSSPHNFLMTNNRSEVKPIDIIYLKGKRLVIASETQAGASLNESFVKLITGGDSITARGHYKENEVFAPTHKLVLQTNHLPRINNDDEGIWRRLNRVPFEAFIPKNERDKDLRLKLRKEQEGIFAWMVLGCLKWQEEGLSPPSIVIDATEEYRNDSSVFKQFIDEYCEISPISDFFTPFSEFTVALKEYLGEQGYSYVFGPRKIKEELERVGCKYIKNKGKRGYSGIKLLTSNVPSGLDF